jgi:hypothetical protein
VQDFRRSDALISRSARAAPGAGRHSRHRAACTGQIPDIMAPVQAGPQVHSRDLEDPFSGRVVGDVERRDVPFIVDDTAIVEFYAR